MRVTPTAAQVIAQMYDASFIQLKPKIHYRLVGDGATECRVHRGFQHLEPLKMLTMGLPVEDSAARPWVGDWLLQALQGKQQMNSSFEMLDHFQVIA